MSWLKYVKISCFTLFIVICLKHYWENALFDQTVKKNSLDYSILIHQFVTNYVPKRRKKHLYKQQSGLFLWYVTETDICILIRVMNNSWRIRNFYAEQYSSKRNKCLANLVMVKIRLPQLKKEQKKYEQPHLACDKQKILRETWTL